MRLAPLIASIVPLLVKLPFDVDGDGLSSNVGGDRSLVDNMVGRTANRQTADLTTPTADGYRRADGQSVGTLDCDVLDAVGTLEGDGSGGKGLCFLKSKVCAHAAEPGLAVKRQPIDA